jgi:hypothetical protein
MRDRLAKLILLAAGLVASLGTAELVVRATGQASSLWSLFAPHPELGWTFVPSRRSGNPRLLSNRLGFRDVEHDVAKPAGTRRLVVLGDSFTAAAELRFDRIYPRVLQRRLDERSAEPWEVISLAVTGWGTAQEWLALERYGLAYAPDAVLLQFFPNDVCNNTPAAADLCAFHDGMRPYLVEQDGSWRVTWKEPLRQRLRRHFALYRLAERGLEVARLRWGSGGLGRVGSAEEARRARAEQSERIRAELGVELHPFFYAYAADGDQIPLIAQGWSATERLIEGMARRLRAAEIPFALVVMPYEGAVDPAGWEAQWSGAARPPVPLVRDQPEQRLARLAARLGIPTCLLLERFEQDREVVLPYRKYHLSPGGHRVAADGIYELLVGAGIVRERGPSGPRPAPGHSR